MFIKKAFLAWEFVIALGLLLMFCFSEQLSAQQQDANKSADFFEMSLEKLMEVEIDVPATITEKDPLKTPASVTVISAKDIARTPARNLMDLLEIYVPGALWMNHSVGSLRWSLFRVFRSSAITSGTHTLQDTKNPTQTKQAGSKNRLWLASVIMCDFNECMNFKAAFGEE